MLGTPINDAQVPEPDPLAPSLYSCLYWVDHLCDSVHESESKRHSALQSTHTVRQFITTKYLYWLEALSLYKSIAKGISSIARLSSLAQVWHAKTIYTNLVI
jgi:hypothetical protein